MLRSVSWYTYYIISGLYSPSSQPEAPDEQENEGPFVPSRSADSAHQQHIMCTCPESLSTEYATFLALFLQSVC